MSSFPETYNAKNAFSPFRMCSCFDQEIMSSFPLVLAWCLFKCKQLSISCDVFFFAYERVLKVSKMAKRFTKFIFGVI